MSSSLRAEVEVMAGPSDAAVTGSRMPEAKAKGQSFSLAAITRPLSFEHLGLGLRIQEGRYRSFQTTDGLDITTISPVIALRFEPWERLILRVDFGSVLLAQADQMIGGGTVPYHGTGGFEYAFGVGY